MPKYEVYINSDPTGKTFPYTLDGFLQALECAAMTGKPYRLDRVHVVNPDNVDLDNGNGLTEHEEEVALNYWGYGEYL